MNRPEPSSQINRPPERRAAGARQQGSRRRCQLIALAVLSSSLALAACGSSSNPTGTSTKSTDKGSPAAYGKSQLAAAACIRSHGVPSMPDPTFGAGGAQVNLSMPDGIAESQAFALAQKECAKLGLELAGYAPISTATAAEMAQALEIARCIRAHGVPNWPDPSKTLPQNVPPGYNSIGAVPGPAGGPRFLLPNSFKIEAPAVKQALKTCHET